MSDITGAPQQHVEATTSSPQPVDTTDSDDNELNKIKIEYITNSVISNWGEDGKEQMYALLKPFLFQNHNCISNSTYYLTLLDSKSRQTRLTTTISRF